MHVHISWATALIFLLSWIVTAGALNVFARAHPGSRLAQAWMTVASPN